MSNYQNNKLIANYLGFKLVDHPTIQGVKQWINPDSKRFPLLNGLLDFEQNLLFDISYEWLMPVVELIINSKNIPDEGDFNQFFISRISSISVRDKIGDRKFNFLSNQKLLLTSIYEVVIKYLTWLNLQSNKNE